MNRYLEEYADKNIPQLDEYLEQELNEDNIEEPQENKLEMESPLVNCEDCLDCNKYMQAHTIQSGCLAREDPKGKLTPNAYSALKRLDNVCKKYSSNKEVLTLVNA